VLWEFAYDDNWETWSWVVRATTDERCRTPTQAAVRLLEAAWTWERETWGSTLFEEVEDTGLLNEEEIWKIGKRTLNKE
jgi:hypothetical protein